MNEQRSAGEYADGDKACRSVQPGLPTRQASHMDADRFWFAPIDGSLCGRSGELHSLLIPVRCPFGELLRDSGFLEGEHVRERRGIQLQ
ncbi:hypothetical protein [Burkholderia sp. BCC0044]|uniref:hypothetical protein n=1 Tax=Burkholderia sp. BCC0044 TaxID=2676295 RepID=UPI00158BD5AC|nr:hypothetical protein [Burkholderia sp. BCC0044]